MQLPNFISHSLAFFKTAEAHQAKVEAALGSASAAQAEVVRLTGELAARDVTIAANASALADFEGRVSAAVLTANATAKASQDAAEAVAAKASADLAALIADPSEQARMILAKTGTTPAPNVKTDLSEKTMPRAEFSKLTPSEQSAFAKAGGILTN
jgi:hypothetical protein